MTERRAVELDAGARELGRKDVVRIKELLPGMLRYAKVCRTELGYGYTSLWFSLYDGQIITYVDRTSGGLYRMRQIYGNPSKLQTTNYVDPEDWPEIKELYELLDAHCAK